MSALTPETPASRFDRLSGDVLASLSSSLPLVSSNKSALEKNIKTVISQFLKMSAPEQKARAHEFKAVLLLAKDFSTKAAILTKCGNAYFSTIGRISGGFTRSTPTQISTSTLEVLSKRNEQILRNHHEFSGPLNSAEAAMILDAHPDKDWLVRYSSDQHSMVVTLRQPDGSYQHQVLDKNQFMTMEALKVAHGADSFVCDKEMLTIIEAHKKGKLQDLVIAAFKHKDGNPSLCNKLFALADALGINIEEVLEKAYFANEFVDLEKALLGNDRPNPRIYQCLANIYERQGNFAAAASSLEKLKSVQPERSPEIDAKLQQLNSQLKDQQMKMLKTFLALLKSGEFEVFRPNKVVDPNLSPVDHLAIFAYTTSMYKIMNAILLDNPSRLEGEWNHLNTLSDQQKHDLKTVIRQLLPIINSALAKLPNNETTLFRGAVFNKSKIAEFQLGKEITLEGLSSSTSNLLLARKFADCFEEEEEGVVFQILSKKGKDITNLSMMSNEAETLFLPHSKFMVVGTDQIFERKRVIQLAQIE